MKPIEIILNSPPNREELLKRIIHGQVILVTDEENHQGMQRQINPPFLIVANSRCAVNPFITQDDHNIYFDAMSIAEIKPVSAKYHTKSPYGNCIGIKPAIDLYVDGETDVVKDVLISAGIPQRRIFRIKGTAQILPMSEAPTPFLASHGRFSYHPSDVIIGTDAIRSINNILYNPILCKYFPHRSIKSQNEAEKNNQSGTEATG